jgi:MFS family permease
MSMFGTNIWPRQTTPTLILGSITSAVGITVLAFATYSENQPLIFGMMALTGTGVGLRLNTASLHALAFFPDLTAQITCLVAFAVPFGGTVILTIMSTVYNNKTNVDDGGIAGMGRENAKQGVKFAFIAVMPFMWLCVVLCGFLGNVWIEKGEGGHHVSGQMWIVGLLTGRKMVKETKQRMGYGPGGVAPAPGAAVARGDLEEGKGEEMHDLDHEGVQNGSHESKRA